MVPTLTGKPGKMGKHFPVREKSENCVNRLEKSGNFTQNIGKLGEFYVKYWKSEDILASFYIYCFSDSLVEVPLLNRFLYLLNTLNETQK